MVDRVKGWVKQGYWFSRESAIMLGFLLSAPDWVVSDDTDGNGNFLPGTTGAKCIELMQTYGTVVWVGIYDANANDQINFILDGHSLDVDANGTLTADQRTEIKNLIEAHVSHTCTVDAQSGGWYASTRQNWELGNGIIANITSHS